MAEAPTTFSSQIFRDLRARFKKKVLRHYEEPWMKMRELDIIKEVLQKLKPSRCLEWGSGYSTIYFPKFQPSIKEWHAIEHHPGWAEIIKNKNTDPRISLHSIGPDAVDYFQFKGKYGPKLEGTYDGFKSYIEFPLTLGGQFDFIFIDGRARKECLKLAYRLVSDEGVVIVHDANRDTYFEDLPSFDSYVRFTDFRQHRKEGGIWLGRKNKKISELLDIQHHESLWNQHNLLAQIFFLR